MRATTITVGPLAAASANNIALSQTPSAGFTLNGTLATGGVATLDTPRRILFTTTADESGKTLTIVGTDGNGSTQTELLTGPNNTTGYTVLDYKTVTSITTSATLSAVTVGTNQVASSRWVRLDEFASPQSTIQVTVSGTVNYTVQQTMQDPNSPTNPVLPYLVNWTDSPDPNVVASTATFGSSFTNAPLWARVTLNSETGTGSLSAVIAQSGSVAY